MSRLHAGWRRGNIRRFASMKTGHTPSRSVPEYWEDTTIPWFTLADVWQLRDGQQIYLGETANSISELGLRKLGGRVAAGGDRSPIADSFGGLLRGHASPNGYEPGFLELGLWSGRLA